MIRIVEIEPPFAVSLFPQVPPQFLPAPPPLGVEQPTMAGLIGGAHAMRQLLPAAARREDRQNAIKHCTRIAPGTTRGCGGWQEPFEPLPVPGCQIGTIGFPRKSGQGDREYSCGGNARFFMTKYLTFSGNLHLFRDTVGQRITS